MYTTLLVNAMIEEGRMLMQKLDEERFPVKAAFWCQIDESLDWRLVIASPVVDRDGPRGAYERLLEIFPKLPARQLEFSDVTVLSPRSQRYKGIRQAALGFGGSANRRIEDKAYHNAYVYRA